MLASDFISLEISFAVPGTATAEELRLRRQVHTIANDVLRTAGLGHVCGVGQGEGRAGISVDVRQAAMQQAWSALHDQFQAAGALDRLTVTAYGTGSDSATVLWPVPADDQEPPHDDPVPVGPPCA